MTEYRVDYRKGIGNAESDHSGNISSLSRGAAAGAENSRYRDCGWLFEPPDKRSMRQVHGSLRGLGTWWTLVVILTAVLSGHAWAQNSTNCRVIAYLPPMATLTGPATAPPGTTEVGLVFGGYGEILSAPCIHAGGENWLVRFRRGLSKGIDLGFDFQTNNQTDGSLGGTGKLAIRYRVTNRFRLEGGVGVADGGDGGDVNADVAAVIGTHNPNRTWNYYASLRLGAARGCLNCGTNIDHAPGALVPLGTIGTTARISNNTRFVMEAGLGEIFARQYSAPAGYIHLSFGVLFDVGKSRD